jgi:hypothetical protein
VRFRYQYQSKDGLAPSEKSDGLTGEQGRACSSASNLVQLCTQTHAVSKGDHAVSVATGVLTCYQTEACRERDLTTATHRPGAMSMLSDTQASDQARCRFQCQNGADPVSSEKGDSLTAERSGACSSVPNLVHPGTQFHAVGKGDHAVSAATGTWTCCQPEACRGRDPRTAAHRPGARCMSSDTQTSGQGRRRRQYQSKVGLAPSEKSDGLTGEQGRACSSASNSVQLGTQTHAVSKGDHAVSVATGVSTCYQPEACRGRDPTAAAHRPGAMSTLSDTQASDRARLMEKTQVQAQIRARVPK